MARGGSDQPFATARLHCQGVQAAQIDALARRVIQAPRARRPPPRSERWGCSHAGGMRSGAPSAKAPLTRTQWRTGASQGAWICSQIPGDQRAVGVQLSGVAADSKLNQPAQKSSANAASRRISLAASNSRRAGREFSWEKRLKAPIPRLKQRRPYPLSLSPAFGGRSFMSAPPIRPLQRNSGKVLLLHHLLQKHLAVLVHDFNYLRRMVRILGGHQLTVHELLMWSDSMHPCAHGRRL